MCTQMCNGVLFNLNIMMEKNLGICFPGLPQKSSITIVMPLAISDLKLSVVF